MSTPTADAEDPRRCWQCDGAGYLAPANRIKPKGGSPSLIKCAICNGEGHLAEPRVIVPKAEHDRLMAALERATLLGRLGDVIPALYNAYRAKLGGQP